MLVLTCDGLPDLDLEDPLSGVFCTKLDLGWPTVRESVSDQPGRDGDTDRTTHFGSRAVAITVDVGPGTIGQRSDVIARLTPFMHARRRPVIVYTDDMGGANSGSREMTLAPREMSGDRAGEQAAEMLLQFTAPAGVAVDAQPITFTLHPLSGGSAGGAAFDIIFDLTFPAASAVTPPQLPIIGDAQPQVNAVIYGPCQGPKVTVTQEDESWVVLAMLADKSLNTGEFITIDFQTGAVLMNGDPGASRFEWVDHAVSTWRLPMPGWATISLETETSTPSATLVITGRATYLL